MPSLKAMDDTTARVREVKSFLIRLFTRLTGTMQSNFTVIVEPENTLRIDFDLRSGFFVREHTGPRIPLDEVDSYMVLKVAACLPQIFEKIART